MNEARFFQLTGEFRAIYYEDASVEGDYHLMMPNFFRASLTASLNRSRVETTEIFSLLSRILTVYLSGFPGVFIRSM